MGKRLVIKGADFSDNALETGGSVILVNNNYSWAKGGITQPGSSSGSTNPTMSMVGLPLQQATEAITFVVANNYGISGVLTSDIASPSQSSQYTYLQYPSGSELETITIPSGKYFQISLRNKTGSNADITLGQSSLLIRQIIQ